VSPEYFKYFKVFLWEAVMFSAWVKYLCVPV